MGGTGTGGAEESFLDDSYANTDGKGRVPYDAFIRAEGNRNAVLKENSELVETYTSNIREVFTKYGIEKKVPETAPKELSDIPHWSFLVGYLAVKASAGDLNMEKEDLENITDSFQELSKIFGSKWLNRNIKGLEALSSQAEKI